MAEITAALVKELRETTGAGMMDCKRALTEADGNLQDAIDWLRKKGLSAAAKKSGRVAAEGLVGTASAPNRAAMVEVNAETDFVARNDAFQEFVATVARVALDEGEDIETIKAAPYPGTGRSVAEEMTHLIATIGENMILRRARVLSVSSGVVATYVHAALKPGLGKIGCLVAVVAASELAALEILGRQIGMHIAAARPDALDVDAVDPAALERERAVLSEQARASGKPEAIIEKMVDGRVRKYYEEVVLLEQVWVHDGETRGARGREEGRRQADRLCALPVGRGRGSRPAGRFRGRSGRRRRRVMPARPAPAGRDIEDFDLSDVRFALFAGAAAILLVLAAYGVGEYLPAALQCGDAGHCSKAHGDWLSPFFVWDAGWYERIASGGYAWQPNVTGHQNPAFWPAWPLILAGLHILAPAAAIYRPAVACLTICLALASGVAFQALASLCLARATARRATILYLLYPGMHYLLRSYPVGLLNIGVCLVLYALIRHRLWPAALMSGVTMAAAPLALSAALTVGLAALSGQRKILLGPAVPFGRRGLAWLKLGVLGMLSLSGLLGFMAFLHMRFDNPLVFISAEQAWGQHPTLLARIGNWLRWEAIFPDIRLALRHGGDILHAPRLADANAALQDRLNAVGFAIGLSSLYAGWRGLPRVVAVQGWLALALYVWFIATTHGHEATLRLIFVAPGCFIGLAYLLGRRNFPFFLIAAVSLTLLLFEAVATAAGFWIV